VELQGLQKRESDACAAAAGGRRLAAAEDGTCLENGQVGTTDGGLVGEKSLCVRLRDQSMVEVSVENLRPRSRLWDINFDKSVEILKWRSEQGCLFVDVDNQQRQFSLQLPLGFKKHLRNKGQGQAQWPLILYMHGSGKTTFYMSQTKKAVHSPGMEYAAERFIVVSPHCDWDWKARPSDWVKHLLRHLRATTWVDPRRIYITGCSMGGMGTWEVAATVPDCIAAIAPVAAHHDAKRTDHLADRLCNMPILAVHSTTDTTCLLKGEEELWNGLRRRGNDSMEVQCAPGVVHTEMFPRTYCDHPTLFKWLLRHKRSDDGFID
jgi:predicted esterase